MTDQLGVSKTAITAVLEGFFEKGGEARCPAAQIGRYADTRNRYLRCGVEDRLRPGHGHFPIGSNPLGVMTFCCDAYQACPVWQADKDDDPITDRVRTAFERDEAKAVTDRQIEAGIRVDDREHEAETEDVVTQALAEPMVEAAADVARRNAERRWSQS